MKIFAIGHNYKAHNQELDNPNPEEPVVFMKPDSALLKDNKPFFLPDFSQEVHYETEIIIKINRIGKNISEKFADRYFDEIGLGVDFTARDLQRKLKKEGKPWEICKGFDGSAVIGSFFSKSEFEDLQNIDFHLTINGDEVQRGNSKDMIFSVNKIISYVSRFFTLKIGDIIFTGTPVGVGQVEINDHLVGYIQDKQAFNFRVK